MLLEVNPDQRHSSAARRDSKRTLKRPSGTSERDCLRSSDIIKTIVNVVLSTHTVVFYFWNR